MFMNCDSHAVLRSRAAQNTALFGVLRSNAFELSALPVLTSFAGRAQNDETILRKRYFTIEGQQFVSIHPCAIHILLHLRNGR